MDNDFLKKITCAHSIITEPDENGDSICLKCGIVVETRFNLDRFQKKMKKYFDS